MHKRLPIATIAASTALFMTGVAGAASPPHRAASTTPPPAKHSHGHVDKPSAASAIGFALRDGSGRASVTGV